MMTPLAYYYLLGMGIVFIGFEAILFSFFLMWIGVGFVIVGLLSIFILFSSAWVQVALSFAIGLLLVVMFRKRMLEQFSKSDSTEETVVHKEGIGKVQGGAIAMDGTFWQTDSDLSAYKEGDKVTVKIEHNKAIVV